MVKKEIKKRLTIKLSFEKHTEIKMTSSSLGITMTEFVDDAIKNYILKLKKEKYANTSIKY